MSRSGRDKAETRQAELLRIVCDALPEVDFSQVKMIASIKLTSYVLDSRYFMMLYNSLSLSSALYVLDCSLKISFLLAMKSTKHYQVISSLKLFHVVPSQT